MTQQVREDLEKDVEKSEKSENKNKEIVVDKVTIKEKSKPKKIIVEWNTTLKTKRRTKKADSLTLISLE